MFEEAQLYSPVTQADDGAVTVHLADTHPGAGDAAYQQRRNEIAAAALAWQPGAPAPRIDYTEAEHDVWRTVWRELSPKHEQLACRAFNEAVVALDLPRDHIPQLEEITARMHELTGFGYVPAAGIVGIDEFYGSLADRLFHSTQYLRHGAAPLYTPEPDLIHEVIGHGHLLADPQLAELNRLAGEAARRTRTPEGIQLVADVFWFTIEFGVVHEDGALRAYGAGLLSSYGEIEEFRAADVRPLDFAAMATLAYDITRYQPVLFAAASMEHLVDAVGGFFAACDDDTRSACSARPARRASYACAASSGRRAAEPAAPPAGWSEKRWASKSIRTAPTFIGGGSPGAPPSRSAACSSISSVRSSRAANAADSSDQPRSSSLSAVRATIASLRSKPPAAAELRQ
jgi:phenylalanine-4-hydroxylase